MDVKISNMLGKSVSVKLGPNNKLNLSHLSSGVHFINFIFANKTVTLGLLKI